MNESDFGEMKADVKNLVSTCKEIKESLARYGERTGALEKAQSECDKNNEVLKVDVANVKEKVTDLQTGRNWLVGGVLTGFAAQIWDLLRGK